MSVMTVMGKGFILVFVGQIVLKTSVKLDFIYNITHS